MPLSTLTELQGTYGLPNAATSDALTAANQSIFDTVNSLLAETRSNSLEKLTARGLGQSTFGEQAMNKQGTDIMNQATGLIANNNLANVNADTQMFRDIFKMGAETDLKTQLAGGQAKALGDAQSKLQLEQFLPTLVLDQAKMFSENKPAPLFDWVVSSFKNLFNKAQGSTGVQMESAPSGSDLANQIKAFFNISF
jgi:hypothetical protein